MKRLLLFVLTAGAFAACSKDKFKTVPQVEIIEFGPSEVTFGELIRFRANVTDKEGDVQDSVIFYRKIFNPVTNDLLRTDSSLKYSLQKLGVPSKDKIELQLTLVYGRRIPEIGDIQDADNVDRHLKIGVYVKDKAGHRSAYVESDKILLKKP